MLPNNESSLCRRAGGWIYNHPIVSCLVLGAAGGALVGGVGALASGAILDGLCSIFAASSPSVLAAAGTAGVFGSSGSLTLYGATKAVQSCKEKCCAEDPEERRLLGSVVVADAKMPEDPLKKMRDIAIDMAHMLCEYKGIPEDIEQAYKQFYLNYAQYMANTIGQKNDMVLMPTRFIVITDDNNEDKNHERYRDETLVSKTAGELLKYMDDMLKNRQCDIAKWKKEAVRQSESQHYQPRHVMGNALRFS